MKRVISILFIMFISIYAKDINKYLNFTNQLINYHITLNNFNKIKSPFELNTPKIINGKKVKNIKGFAKIVRVKLLSTFDKRAYVLIKVYVGDQLIKQYRKWVKIGDKIENCKVSSVYFQKLILKCNNKTLIKTLYKKIPGIKEIK